MLDRLELELQVVVTGQMWGLRMELGSSARAICARNHGAISPVPKGIALK